MIVVIVKLKVMILEVLLNSDLFLRVVMILFGIVILVVIDEIVMVLVGVIIVLRVKVSVSENLGISKWVIVLIIRMVMMVNIIESERVVLNWWLSLWMLVFWLLLNIKIEIMMNRKILGFNLKFWYNGIRDKINLVLICKKVIGIWLKCV